MAHFFFDFKDTRTQDSCALFLALLSSSFSSRYNACCVSVIKTRIQAQTQYLNSLHCAYRIFTEGLRRFLTGTTPRLARLVVRSSFPFLLCSFMRVITRVHIR
ncbi:hypothetical protein EDB89DRAFT_1976403 [Lactarius sanguifluus]|nr:hypothetical protein EDB89DRAFT_1976403 [Lactarius sanguifluus]